MTSRSDWFHKPPTNREILIWIITMVALLTALSIQSFSQDLLSEINSHRGAKHQLVYDSSKQAGLDAYVLTKRFRSFTHSTRNCGEIMCESRDGDVEQIMKMWMMSPGHRRNLKDNRYKSMCCRLVQVRPDYYIAIVQFF